MSTLNPETWNEVSRALEGTPGGFVFDMLFGTSPEGNTTQAYMDEQQLAYLAWYMQQNGVFGGSINYKPAGNYHGKAKPYTLGSNDFSEILNDTTLTNDAQKKALTEFISFNGNMPILSITGRVSPSYYSGFRYIPAQDIPEYDYSIDEYSRVTANIPYSVLLHHQMVVEADESGKISVRDIGNALASSGLSARNSNVVKPGNSNTLGYADVITNPAGVGTQPAATTPDLSTATSVATVLELLKAQFPELWTNAVTNTVLQPDGALKTFTYVPVPTPEAATALDPQPVTGPATQANPQVNPETAPSLKDLITNIIPTIDPTQNKPDIGAGNTPTVVPQTGKASSLYSVYNPSQEQLNQFGAWLWSSDFFEQIKKLFNDPMQAIIGLHKVYSPVQTSGLGTIKCGYLDSSVPSKLVSEQYVTVDCGSVSLQEYFGNVFDYPPFTEISIYLPFIGVRRLDTSDIMRATVSVKYHVDVFTGACLADVNVKRDTAGGVLYTFPGSCSVQYPLSSGSYMGIVSTIASTVVGAITAPNPLGVGAAVLGGITNLTFNSHANVERSGSFTGNAGAMGAKIPYLIISRPQTAMAQNFETLSGYPSNTYTKLSACTGFTQVKFVHVENLNATDAEKQEIEQLLKEGVIL